MPREFVDEKDLLCRECIVSIYLYQLYLMAVLPIDSIKKREIEYRENVQEILHLQKLFYIIKL